MSQAVIKSLSADRCFVQTQMAPWDALPPEMKDTVFATLSLLDLGRAAPTCREFRAAYKARLAAANAATVQKAAACVSEAVLRAHSTLILRLFWGVDLFSGGDFGGMRYKAFDILDDGTYGVGSRPHLQRPLPVSRVFENQFSPPPMILPDGKRRVHRSYDTRPQCFTASPPWNVGYHPRFALECYSAGEYICIHVWCRILEFREAAAALALTFKYIEADSGRPAGRQQRQALKLAVQFKFCVDESSPLSDLSVAHLDDIAAALLPLFPLLRVLQFLS